MFSDGQHVPRSVLGNTRGVASCDIIPATQHIMQLIANHHCTDVRTRILADNALRVLLTELIITCKTEIINELHPYTIYCQNVT